MSLLERLRNEGTVESTGKFTADEERATYWLFTRKLGGNLTKKLNKLFTPIQYLNHEHLTGEEFANQLLTGRTNFNNIYLQPHYNLATHEKYTEIQEQLKKKQTTTTTTKQQPRRNNSTTMEPKKSKPRRSRPLRSRPNRSKPTKGKPTTSRPNRSKPTKGKPTTSRPYKSKPTRRNLRLADLEGATLD